MENSRRMTKTERMRIAALPIVISAIAIILGASAALIPLRANAREEGPAFAISNQSFWDYYQKRGGVRTFGYPISRQFTLRGFPVQLFQRGALQLNPDGSVSTMNLLDNGLMPYTSFNSSVVPAPQQQLMELAPSPADPDYASKAIAFVRANAPDEWEGLHVNFTRTFMSSVRYEDAFPDGSGAPSLLPLLNLELWGLPTSLPARDPNNGNFVYQRFQRGIMHFDATTRVTQGLLLGNYLKAIITGQDLPPDVQAEAGSSPFYRQYDPATGRGPLRPDALPSTKLDGAFQPGWGDPRFGVVVAGPLTSDPNYVAASLATLGAGSWYSFSGGATAPVAGQVQMVRPGANLTDLAARAQTNPGAAWLIGNEPNVPGQDDMQPAAYADFLSQVAGVIKGADPTALLVGPNVLNWEDTCTSCPGFTKGRDWAEAFVSAYRAKYGSLPLDVWGMHAYSLDWNHLPLANATADKAQLAAAGAWLKSTLPLPLWLTEFGVIWGFDGIDWGEQNGTAIARPAGPYRDDLVGAYLDDMLSWLRSSGANSGVDRWFLYATSPPPEPYATQTAGITLLEPGTIRLTPFGESYRARATGLGPAD